MRTSRRRVRLQLLSPKTKRNCAENNKFIQANELGGVSAVIAPKLKQIISERFHFQEKESKRLQLLGRASSSGSSNKCNI